MHVKQFFVLLSYLSLLTIGLPSDLSAKHPIVEKKGITSLSKDTIDIDNYYDSLVRLKIDNILLFKQLNTASGNYKLIIWKDKHCVYGVKHIESVSGICKTEEIKPNSQKLGLLALKFFYSEVKSYPAPKSKIKTLHNYKIIIRALVNGKGIDSEFTASELGDTQNFLAEISRLCQNIFFDE